MAYGVNAPFGLRPISSINGGTWVDNTNVYYIYTNPTTGLNSYATSLFTGDPVTWNPTLANVAPVIGPMTISVYLPARAVGAPTTYSALPILGVFWGCEYTDTTGRLIKSPFWPGGTAVYPGTFIKAYVVDDPNTIFEVQVSTPGDVLTNAYFPTINGTGPEYPAMAGRNLALDIGNDANPAPHLNVINPASGSTISGLSAFYAVASSATAAAPLTRDYDKTVATLPLKALGYSTNVQNAGGPAPLLANRPFLNIRVTINNHFYGHNTPGTVLA